MNGGSIRSLLRDASKNINLRIDHVIFLKGRNVS